MADTSNSNNNDNLTFKCTSPSCGNIGDKQCYKSHFGKLNFPKEVKPIKIFNTKLEKDIYFLYKCELTGTNRKLNIISLFASKVGCTYCIDRLKNLVDLFTINNEGKLVSVLSEMYNLVYHPYLKLNETDVSSISRIKICDTSLINNFKPYTMGHNCYKNRPFYHLILSLSDYHDDVSFNYNNDYESLCTNFVQSVKTLLDMYSSDNSYSDVFKRIMTEVLPHVQSAEDKYKNAIMWMLEHVELYKQQNESFDEISRYMFIIKMILSHATTNYCGQTFISYTIIKHNIGDLVDELIENPSKDIQQLINLLSQRLNPLTYMRTMTSEFSDSKMLKFNKFIAKHTDDLTADTDIKCHNQRKYDNEHRPNKNPCGNRLMTDDEINEHIKDSISKLKETKFVSNMDNINNSNNNSNIISIELITAEFKKINSITDLLLFMDIFPNMDIFINLTKQSGVPSHPIKLGFYPLLVYQNIATCFYNNDKCIDYFNNCDLNNSTNSSSNDSDYGGITDDFVKISNICPTFFNKDGMFQRCTLLIKDGKIKDVKQGYFKELLTMDYQDEFGAIYNSFCDKTAMRMDSGITSYGLGLSTDSSGKLKEKIRVMFTGVNSLFNIRIKIDKLF